MITLQTFGPVVAEEFVGVTTTSTRTGRLYLVLHSLLNLFVSILFIFLPLFPFKKNSSLFPSRTSPQIALKLDPTSETEASEGVFLPFMIVSFFLLFCSIMGQPSLPLPSFSDFAKISPPVLQRAMCSFIKSLEELEG